MRCEILFAWIGMTDLRCSRGESEGLGPIASAAKSTKYTKIYLLTNSGVGGISEYVGWLNGLTRASIRTVEVRLPSPTHYESIYNAAVRTIKLARAESPGEDCKLTYHLSPGTPAMCAVWLLISKTTYPASLIESSREHGVQSVQVPFELTLDFMPERSPQVDRELHALMDGLPPITPELDAIVHKSEVMKTLLIRARRLAAFDYPVLIQGESGTGKELLAKAIHTSSHQKSGPFVAVNCGAIPDTLIESEFFGHKKGSFTGASNDHLGYFEVAHGGTLFLDEIGDLPLRAQVKVLRFLQEGTLQRVGDTKERRSKVRVVAATNKNLLREVGRGHFREDLFHRLAFGVLNIPPLRERPEDITLLLDSLLAEINLKCSSAPGWKSKKLSLGARNIMRQHPWPGNVRELLNTLVRAAMWAPSETLREEDVLDALFPLDEPTKEKDGILNRPLGKSCALPSIIEEVARHYLVRALETTLGNKTEAAKLVGLSSYQTLSNWMIKYNIEPTVASRDE